MTLPLILVLALTSSTHPPTAQDVLPRSLLRGTTLDDWRSRQGVLTGVLLDERWLESEGAIETVLDFQAVENARLADMVSQGRSVKHEWGNDYVEYYAFELGTAVEAILKTRPTRRVVEIGSRMAFNIGSDFAAQLAQQGARWPQVFTALALATDENTQGKAASVLRFMLAEDTNRVRLSNQNRELVSRTLVTLSASRVPAIQREAALGLAGSDTADAVAALTRLANSDPDSPIGQGVSVREAAQEALAKIRARK